MGELVIQLDATLLGLIITIVTSIVVVAVKLGQHKQLLEDTLQRVARNEGTIEALENRNGANAQALEKLQADTGWIRNKLNEATSKIDTLSVNMARHLGSHDAESGV